MSESRLGRLFRGLTAFTKPEVKEDITVPIYLLDDSMINVTVAKRATAAAVCVAIRLELGLVSDVDFGLYLWTRDTFIYVEMDTPIQRATTMLPETARKETKFYYRRRFTFLDPLSMQAEETYSNLATAAARLTLIQCAFDLLRGPVRFKDPEAPRLAAHLLQTLHGDQAQGENRSTVSKTLANVLPGFELTWTNSKTVCDEIVKAHAELFGTTPVQAHRHFVAQIRRSLFYGADMFTAQRTWRQNGRSEPDSVLRSRFAPVFVVVNGKGIHTIRDSREPDTEGTDVITVAFDTVTKWGVSGDNALFAFLCEDNVEVLLVSEWAVQIGKAFQRYIDEMLTAGNGTPRVQIMADDQRLARIEASHFGSLYNAIDGLTEDTEATSRVARAASVGSTSSASSAPDIGSPPRNVGRGAPTSPISEDMPRPPAAVPADPPVPPPVTRGKASAASPQAPPPESPTLPPPPMPPSPSPVPPPPIPSMDRSPPAPKQTKDAQAALEAEATLKIQKIARGRLQRKKFQDLKASSTAEKPVDSGWQEVVTDEGDVYFYNHITGASQWTRPDDFPAATPTTAEVTAEKAPAAAPDASADASEEVPEGWAVGDSDGTPYYTNTITGASQWTRPTTVALPDGWDEVRDDEGNVYYWNATLGTSSWVRPTE